MDPCWPGCVNDAFVLRESEIGTLGETGQLGNYFLLGDAGLVQILFNSL